jgi:hypothetical protein
MRKKVSWVVGGLLLLIVVSVLIGSRSLLVDGRYDGRGFGAAFTDIIFSNGLVFTEQLGVTNIPLGTYRRTNQTLTWTSNKGRVWDLKPQGLFLDCTPQAEPAKRYRLWRKWRRERMPEPEFEPDRW